MLPDRPIDDGHAGPVGAARRARDGELRRADLALDGDLHGRRHGVAAARRPRPGDRPRRQLPGPHRAAPARAARAARRAARHRRPARGRRRARDPQPAGVDLRLDRAAAAGAAGVRRRPHADDDRAPRDPAPQRADRRPARLREPAAEPAGRLRPRRAGRGDAAGRARRPGLRGRRDRPWTSTSRCRSAPIRPSCGRWCGTSSATPPTPPRPAASTCASRRAARPMQRDDHGRRRRAGHRARSGSSRIFDPFFTTKRRAPAWASRPATRSSPSTAAGSTSRARSARARRWWSRSRRGR